MKKILNYIELILLALIIILAVIGKLINSTFLILFFPAFLGCLGVLFINMIKLSAWYQKTTYITFISIFGRKFQVRTRNKNKVKDIKGNKVNSKSSAPNTFE